MNNWISANADIQRGRESIENTVRNLQRNAELYHQGHVSHADFCRRNERLWDTAEEFGYADDVRRVLFGSK